MTHPAVVVSAFESALVRVEAMDLRTVGSLALAENDVVLEECATRIQALRTRIVDVIHARAEDRARKIELQGVTSGDKTGACA